MVLDRIKDTLIQLDSAIKESNSAAITQSLRSLDQLVSSHRGELDAQLRHFLERRSYQKALAYLEGESDIPKGRCQGREEFK